MEEQPPAPRNGPWRPTDMNRRLRATASRSVVATAEECATMRPVFQLRASITSVVNAPRLVSSLAKPTRPEWAVRAVRAGANNGEQNRSP